MKTKELTGYGVTGIKIELNLMDRYEASHLLERVNGMLSGREAECQGCSTLNSYGIQEMYTILEMMGAFLSKIALKSSEKGDMFTPEEEEGVLAHKETEQC